MRKAGFMIALVLALWAMSARAQTGGAGGAGAGGAIALGAAGAAGAQALPAPIVVPTDPGDIAKTIFNAVAKGEWKVVSIWLLVALIWAVRTYGKKIPAPVGPWLETDRGGAMLALATGAIVVVGGAVGAGIPIDRAVLMNAVGTGVTAMGGWAVWAKLIRGGAEGEARREAKRQSQSPPAPPAAAT